MGNSRLFVIKWYEGFNPLTKNVANVPMWVQLFGLLQHLWSLNIIKLIGNYIEEIIKMDESFESRETALIARVYVNMNIQEPLPTKIKIKTKLEEWK